MQAVEASAANEPAMGPGTIYGSLQRMEEAGLVKEVTARTDDRRGLHAAAGRPARWRRRPNGWRALPRWSVRNG